MHDDEKRHRLPGMFSSYAHLRAVIEGVIEGVLGSVRVAEDGDSARLDVGVYSILGGSASSPGAMSLLREVPARFEIVLPPEDDDWRALISSSHGDRAVCRSMDALVPADVTASRLTDVAARLPQGFEFVECDASVAERIGPELSPNRPLNFGSFEAFGRLGIGTAVRHAGRLVCASTTYTVSSRLAEIAIATHPEFRRRGLATPTAAHAVHRCLSRGLETHWSAANEASRRIAAVLGFVPAGRFEVFDVGDGTD